MDAEINHTEEKIEWMKAWKLERNKQWKRGREKKKEIQKEKRQTERKKTERKKKDRQKERLSVMTYNIDKETDEQSSKETGRHRHAKAKK